MSKPTELCPFYGMPCEHVPMAHESVRLRAEVDSLRAQLAEREGREAMVLTQLGYHAEYVKGEKLNRMHINRAATVLKQHCENILKHGTTSPRFHAAEGEG